VLLYPVYAVLFTDSGLSVAEISSLFVIWAVTGIVLEVPSGVWADAVSRRLLLAGAPLLKGAGFALWVFAPSYWVFAAGFVLWGAQGAVQSGALEALVYTELEHRNAAGEYAKIMGRARSCGFVAVMLSTAAAGPVFAVGGYVALGIASVLACAAGAAVGLRFTERRRFSEHNRFIKHSAAEDEGFGYFATLKAGLTEARESRSVRRLLLIIPALTAIWGALEEYDALLAIDTGVAVETVPWLMLLLWAGVTTGGLLAPIGERMPGKAFAGTVAAAALAMAAGALSGRPAGFVLLAVAYCAFQMATVVADARLQATISGPSRATVTSLAGLGTDLATVGVYSAYAAGSAFFANSTIYALFAVPYAVIAFWLASGDRRCTTNMP
jgi:MFS family permease